ncbi:MAG: hypothetical protein EHM33_00795 [Chloroflexi bacterium]|nr:MAG: hypothetical protein EHM33_00795 [Chloroflexota bacterium]
MSEIDTDKMTTDITRRMSKLPHGDRICEQQGKCTCGRDSLMLMVFAQIAAMLEECDEAKELRAENARLSGKVAQAREALAACDPWVLKSERPLLYECVVCKHEYDMRADNPSDSHEKDCVWFAALSALDGDK